MALAYANSIGRFIRIPNATKFEPIGFPIRFAAGICDFDIT